MWVLNCGGSFPCGVFETKEAAEDIIKKYKLTGVLTQYPVNMLVIDWAIENNCLSESARTTEDAGTYATAYQKHYHYENGE